MYISGQQRGARRIRRDKRRNLAWRVRGRSEGAWKAEDSDDLGFMVTEESREKKGVMENKGGTDMEGSRLGDTHYKSNLQLAEDISGYFVERTRVYSGL